MTWSGCPEHGGMLRCLRDRETNSAGLTPLGIRTTLTSVPELWPKMRMESALRHHHGCVNFVSFNSTGEVLRARSAMTKRGPTWQRGWATTCHGREGAVPLEITWWTRVASAAKAWESWFIEFMLELRC